MSNECPVLWPEDPTPRTLVDCSECGLDKQGSRMVWGEGNPEAPIYVLLDNPGAREDKEGNFFVYGTSYRLLNVARILVSITQYFTFLCSEE